MNQPDRLAPAKGRKNSGSVEDLFDAYISHLGKRPSADAARLILLGERGLAQAIGPDRPARSVRKDDIIPHLAKIHRRGAPARASQVRATAHAAFSFGIKAENSYILTAGPQRWGLENNPVSGIARNPHATKPGERNLSEEELRAFWRWLEANGGANRACAALQLIIATGQRPAEILQLTVDHYDAAEGLLRWKKTKNGRPHCIPLPQQAIRVLERLTPDAAGRYFSSRNASERHAATGAVTRLARRYLDETGVDRFTPRDLRRTWKTLAGAAGVSKEVRDRLQNHSDNGVSARHYDRWSYLPEKRAGMVLWEQYLGRILYAPIDHDGLPPAFDPVGLVRLSRLMRDRPWRAAPQARHTGRWIGHAVGRAFGRKRASLPVLTALTRGLHSAGVLRRTSIRDQSRRAKVPVYYFNQEALSAQGNAPLRAH